jgi:uncharacterized membrane protein YhaH (DUF805 family)
MQGEIRKATRVGNHLNNYIMAFQYYLDAFRNYATFTGRARRSEYWYFVLFNLIATVLCMGVDNALGTTIDPLPYGYIYYLYNLAVIVPSLSIGTRRLHDVGKSGWMILIALIPLVGAIWLLVLFCTDSNFGTNQYGPNPKGIGNDQDDENLIQNIGQ